MVLPFPIPPIATGSFCPSEDGRGLARLYITPRHLAKAQRNLKRPRSCLPALGAPAANPQVTCLSPQLLRPGPETMRHRSLPLDIDRRSQSAGLWQRGDRPLECRLADRAWSRVVLQILAVYFEPTSTGCLPHGPLRNELHRHRNGAKPGSLHGAETQKCPFARTANSRPVENSL